jgi:hypothetical protein
MIYLPPAANNSCLQITSHTSFTYVGGYHVHNCTTGVVIADFKFALQPGSAAQCSCSSEWPGNSRVTFMSHSITQFEFEDGRTFSKELISFSFYMKFLNRWGLCSNLQGMAASCLYPTFSLHEYQQPCSGSNGSCCSPFLRGSRQKALVFSACSPIFVYMVSIGRFFADQNGRLHASDVPRKSFVEMDTLVSSSINTNTFYSAFSHLPGPLLVGFRQFVTLFDESRFDAHVDGHHVHSSGRGRKLHAVLSRSLVGLQSLSSCPRLIIPWLLHAHSPIDLTGLKRVSYVDEEHIPMLRNFVLLVHHPNFWISWLHPVGLVHSLNLYIHVLTFWSSTDLVGAYYGAIYLKTTFCPTEISAPIIFPVQFPLVEMLLVTRETFLLNRFSLGSKLSEIFLRTYLRLALLPNIGSNGWWTWIKYSILDHSWWPCGGKNANEGQKNMLYGTRVISRYQPRLLPESHLSHDQGYSC